MDECPEGHALLRLQVVTDANGAEENRFVVKKRGDDNKYREKVFIQEDLQSSATETFEMCLPVDECYRFVMWDSGKDGVCCDDGEGGYTVTWDGSLVVDTLSNSGFNKGQRSPSPDFGDTC